MASLELEICIQQEMALKLPLGLLCRFCIFVLLYFQVQRLLIKLLGYLYFLVFKKRSLLSKAFLWDDLDIFTYSSDILLNIFCMIIPPISSLLTKIKDHKQNIINQQSSQHFDHDLSMEFSSEEPPLSFGSFLFLILESKNLSSVTRSLVIPLLGELVEWSKAISFFLSR